jgi:hypothetical protein
MSWKSVDDWLAKNPPSPEEIAEVERYAARMARPRFYADENFPEQAVAILREWGARVQTAGEAGLCGHPDENHASYALKHGLVLLTCDPDFLNHEKFPLNKQCPALFVFDFGSGTEQEMHHAFRCLRSVFSAPQFFDRGCKVDAKRDCWTEWVRYQNGQTSHTRCRYYRGEYQEWVDDGAE